MDAMLAALIVAFSIAVGADMISTSVEKAARDMKPEPKVKILYCYKQRGDYPDVCESATSEVQ